MDTTTGLISEELRKKVYDELADAMISAMEKGEMPIEASDESSRFILSRLDGVQTGDELLKFAEEVATKWPIYNNVFVQLKAAHDVQFSQQKAEEIQNTLDTIANS